MAKIDAQTYLKNASEVVRSTLPQGATKYEHYVKMLQELKAYEDELKEQAKSLREAVDFVATDALADGLNFTTIGEALGITKQAANQRYAKDEDGRSREATEFIRRARVNKQ